MEPAYIKPKKTLTPANGYIRLPGTLTPKQRIDMLMAEQTGLY